MSNNIEDSKLLGRIVDAGVSLAFNAKAVGIAGVWAEMLRPYVRFTRDVQTWAVDGKAMHINPDWTATLTPRDIEFLIAHEACHIALDHMSLAQMVGATTADKRRILNIAEDAVINQALVDDGVGTMPEGEKKGVLLRDLQKHGYNGPADSIAVYEWLMKNADVSEDFEAGEGEGEGEEQQEGDQQPGKGKALQGCSPGGLPGTGEEEGASEEQVRANARMKAEKAMAALHEQAQRAGEGSSLARMLKPRPVRASVRQLIRAGFERASINAKNRVLPSYSRASRREALDSSIMLPGKIGTEAKVAFVGDVSGSMTEEGVAALIGMIQSVAREFPDTSVYLVTHTDRVVWEGKLTAGGDLSKAKEATAFSGGTDFAPAYDAVQRAGKFDVCVHFTDGYNMSNWPAKPARELVIGVWGSGQGMTTPPPGAKTIPVAAIGV